MAKDSKGMYYEAEKSMSAKGVYNPDYSAGNGSLSALDSSEMGEKSLCFTFEIPSDCRSLFARRQISALCHTFPRRVNYDGQYFQYIGFWE